MEKSKAFFDEKVFDFGVELHSPDFWI